jgi:hypothetical protein
VRIEDILTAGLIAFAVYFVIVTVRDSARAPRTYYARGELRDTWL